MVLDLWKTCEDSTESSCIPLIQFPTLLISHNTFVKTKKVILTHYCSKI